MKKAIHNKSWFRSENLPLGIIVIYLLVEVVPAFGGVDIMGAQWLYLSFINFLCLLYFFSSKNSIPGSAVKNISIAAQSMALIAFILIAGLSMITAIDRIESLVVYSRLLTTGLMYFNLALLLYGRLSLLKSIAWFLSIVLAIQAIGVIMQYFNGINADTPFDTVISGITLNAGHKNILAASFAIKFPFLVYCILISKAWVKLLPCLILSFATVAIGILNARSSFISIVLQLFIFTGILAIQYARKRNLNESIKVLSFTWLPVIVGFIFSTLILKTALDVQDKATKYGTVEERVLSINFHESSEREKLWLAAIDYIKKHPFRAAGYGNWKLAAIPYEKDITVELYVSYHVHNDFLETTAETGLIGGLIYFLLFIIAGIYLLRLLITKKTGDDLLLIGIASMSFASYFTDATFNFPSERPIMQLFFALILALILNLFLEKRDSKKDASNPPSGKSRIAFLFISIPVIAASLYLNLSVYKTMVAQYDINEDMMNGAFVKSFAEVDKELPSIPTLNVYCLPMELIKGRYLMNEKRYREAIQMLERCREQSYKLSLNEFFTAQSYLELGLKDSAYYWADKAFYYRPRVRNNYILLNQLLAERKDRAGIDRAFKTASKLRDRSWVWDVYLTTLDLLGENSDKLQRVSDSALRLFPNDPVILARTKGITSTIAKSYFDSATLVGQNKDYANAIRLFIKASELNPGDYSSYENIGLTYYKMQDYVKALDWFDKVIALGTAVDGKSWYFRGICLINLSRITDGCVSLKEAAARKFGGAEEALKKNCK